MTSKSFNFGFRCSLAGCVLLAGLIAVGQEMSPRIINRLEAIALYGGLPQSWQNGKVCAEIPECKISWCQGGEFSCPTHLVRNQTNMVGQYGINSCSITPNSANCFCQKSDLRYTCSYVVAGCCWDSEESKCVECEGTGFQLAPQWCHHFCPGY
jgi:hypothetical protein